MSELSHVLFDLDGTLVSMSSRRAELALMARVARRFSPVVSTLRFPDFFWRGARRMLENRSDLCNQDALVAALSEGCAWDRKQVEAALNEAVDEDFPRVAPLIRGIEGARECVEAARERGLAVVLATNPVWPERAVRWRLAWGELGDLEFDFVTHNQNMTRCKPSVEYYQQLLSRIGVRPERCLMVGNDPRKDLPAREAGIATYLIARRSSALRKALRDPRTSGCGTLGELRDWLLETSAGQEVPAGSGLEPKGAVV